MTSTVRAPIDGVAIRSFTAEDYPAFAAIESAAYPGYAHDPDNLRWVDENRDPRIRHARWIAEVDGKAVGMGQHSQYADMYHPRKFTLNISVVPEYQGRGIGAALYETILGALAAFDPISVRAMVREDMARSIRFVADRGFVETMRFRESRLDVTAFDFAPYAEVEEKLRAGGIETRSLAEMTVDETIERAMWLLDEELSADVPYPEPHTKVPFEQYVTFNFRNPKAFFVAIERATGEYAGMSNLWVSDDGRNLETGFTGVRRAYRRRGIALALKVRGVRWAAENGCPEIRTWNESYNRPMLAINELLGYAKQPAWISFRKELGKE